ncbi:hypothetical protein [Candidatus Accumulibacter sp. ACC007]|uniref:hypothetical protein n=1 Tax=Candidatus Accumulibacter sp. ACC007 TaxID=2823333 RepID=UPI0025C5E444|nr:hypothetical protein [Candidatus Accumulibacter sp. ACC007]
MVAPDAGQSIEQNYQEISEMKAGGSIRATLLVSALLLALSACQKHESEGPAEHAGKEIDKVVAKAGQQVEKAGEEINKVVEKAGQQVEKAGEAIQDAAKGDKE